MPPSLEELGLLKLSREDREAVAHALLHSLEPEAEGEPLSEELKAELDRRIAESDADPNGGIPAEEVHARIMARFQR